MCFCWSAHCAPLNLGKVRGQAQELGGFPAKLSTHNSSNTSSKVPAVCEAIGRADASRRVSSCVVELVEVAQLADVVDDVRVLVVDPGGLGAAVDEACVVHARSLPSPLLAAASTTSARVTTLPASQRPGAVHARCLRAWRRREGCPRSRRPIEAAMRLGRTSRRDRASASAPWRSTRAP